MSQILQIVITASATFLAGVILFVISQIITKAIIDPYVSYRETLSKVTYKMILYADHICSARPEDNPEKNLKIAFEVRELSAELRATLTKVPFVPLLRWLRLLPDAKDFEEACGLLMRVSNSLNHTDKPYIRIYEDIRLCGRLLRIDL